MAFAPLVIHQPQPRPCTSWAPATGRCARHLPSSGRQDRGCVRLRRDGDTEDTSASPATAELRNETERTEDFVMGPTATKHLPTHPTGQLTTPPDNSIVSRTAPAPPISTRRVPRSMANSPPFAISRGISPRGVGPYTYLLSCRFRIRVADGDGSTRAFAEFSLKWPTRFSQSRGRS